MLFTGESDIGPMDGVPPNHVNDLVVLVRRRPEGSSTGGNIVEQILNRDLRALPAGNRLGVRRLTGLGRHQLPAVIVGTPGTIRLAGLRGYREMGNVADAGQGLTPKPVGGDGLEVLELLQLRRGETLAQYRQV